jgi:hypothetical protein
MPEDFDPTVALVLGYPAEAPAGSPRIRPVIHWCSSDPLRSEPTARHPDN